ncbi:hypothetical protein HMPREF1869_00092 [Bacteroidales bacterium KA00251]|nr:hypothetical protein HMPREF1869_00092 [Bacteroidales bacterium KA00251]
MKKTIAIAPLLLLASMLTLLVGCNRSTGAEEPTHKQGKPSLTFTLQMPQGEPVTYRSAIHDEPEWTIKSLTMYQFNADGSKLLSIDNIDMTKLQKTADAEYSYTKEFAESAVGVFQFVFVANESVAGAIVNTTSLADFEKIITAKRLSDNGTSRDLVSSEIAGSTSDYTIPMTGFAEQGNSRLIALTGTTGPTTVTLTRVLARIDISNHIPNLNVTKVSIKNAYDCTSLFPSRDLSGEISYVAPAGASQVTMSAGFAELPNPFKGSTGVKGNELKKAFYLYEGTQPTESAQQDKATTVVIEGELSNGKHIVLDIPFVRNSNAYTPITIKRNNLYHLVLGNNSPIEENSKIAFSIEDTPWNAIILNHEMQPIEISCWEAESSVKHWDPLTHTLYSQARDKFKFKVTTFLANHTDFTVNMIHSDSGLPYAMEKKMEVDKLFWIIGTYPNLSGTAFKDKDTVVFEISSNAAPEIKSYLTWVYDRNYKNPNWK